jgi:hypothetical protein
MRLRKAELRGRVKADLTLRFTRSGLTSFAGLELVRRYFRQLGLFEKIRRHVSATAPGTDYGVVGMIMVVLTLFCIIGKSILLMATYNEKMKRHEAERLQRPRGQSTGAAGRELQRPAGAEPR